MKDELNRIFNDNDKGRIEKALKFLNSFYHTHSSFIRIIELCDHLNVATGGQNLDERILSYSIFHSEKLLNNHNTRNLIIVNDNLDFKEKNILFSYNFFRYILSDSKKSEYKIYKVFYKKGFYTNTKPYKLALQLLLPEKDIVIDYKKYSDKCYDNKKILEMLSGKYLVPIEDVSRRIDDLLYNKQNNENKGLFKKIKRI